MINPAVTLVHSPYVMSLFPPFFLSKLCSGRIYGDVQDACACVRESTAAVHVNFCRPLVSIDLTERIGNPFDFFQSHTRVCID